MPKTELKFFQEDDGKAPVLDWMDELPERARDKGLKALEELAKHGHELRRPLQDTLRDGVHELRWRLGTVNYRILFTVEVRTIALLACGLTKEKAVPGKEIDKAAERAARWRKDPKRYTYEQEDK